MRTYQEVVFTKDGQDIIALYRQVGWQAYLQDDEKLARAFQKSLYVLGAFDEGKLVGFVRCVGDGEHIVLVQDLLVAPDYQGKGIGKALFSQVWNRYEDVRMFHVVTDGEDVRDNAFYHSFGMKPLDQGGMISYFRIKENA